MVKGISRRVIVVRAPDPRFFEQAVFFLRDDALHRPGITDEQVLSEARRAAAGFVRRSRSGKRWKHWLERALWGAAGSALASAVWLAAVLI